MHKLFKKVHKQQTLNVTLEAGYKKPKEKKSYRFKRSPQKYYFKE